MEIKIELGGAPSAAIREDRVDYERGFAYGEQLRAQHDPDAVRALTNREPMNEYERGAWAALNGERSRYAGR